MIWFVVGYLVVGLSIGGVHCWGDAAIRPADNHDKIKSWAWFTAWCLIVWPLIFLVGAIIGAMCLVVWVLGLLKKLLDRG